MEKKSVTPVRLFFDKFSTKATKVTGSPKAFFIALSVVIIWAATGALFNFSDTWQLVINTGTTIVTFLMVFLIQQSQNKDTMALQIKINELVASSDKASNLLIDIEDLTEAEIEHLKEYYIRLSELAKKEKDLQKSHSFSEVETAHKAKYGHKK